MKIRFGCVATLLVVFATSAFASGPMPSEPKSNKGSKRTTTTARTMKPGREQWTKQRIEHLKHKREQEKGDHYGTDIRNPFGLADNPYLTNNEAELRRRDAIRRQHEIDQIELLALKKERGELSPAGQKKLNALIRNVQSGH